MAKLRNGLLGKASGKVGGIVTANWKGINYAREYVIPANPRTVNQTARRDVFANLVFLGRQVKTVLINTFWDNLFKGKSTSGFAQFMGYNQKRITAVTNLENVKLVTGDLEGLIDLSADIQLAGNLIGFSWSDSIVSNGAPTDNVIVYCYVPERNFLYSQANAATRSSKNVIVSIPDLAGVEGKIFYYAQVKNATSTNFSTTQGGQPS